MQLRVAGTARDAIEEVVNIEGSLFRLIKTAGICDHTTDILAGLANHPLFHLIALCIRRCFYYPDEVANEEQLSWIFSKFCIG